MKDNSIFEKEFIKPIVRWGSITCILVALLSLAPPLYMYFVHNIMPPASAILEGFIAIGSIFIVFWIIEPVSYFPMLGIAGTYMSFLSGNISNLRLPCSMIAQEAAGVEQGTDEAAIISVIGIGCSIIVNLAILFIGIIIGTKLIESVSPTVRESFSYLVPAVFGGVFSLFAMKNYRLAVIAIALGASTAAMPFLPMWVSIPGCIFGTVFLGNIWINKLSKV